MVTLASPARGGPSASEEAAVGSPSVRIPSALRVRLLDMARTALGVATGIVPASALDEQLAEVDRREPRAGAFVTLLEDGELRGCMGCLDPARPVSESVAEAAVYAARWDPRFRPLGARELDRTTVAISILGPLRPLPDPRRFRLGVDGLVVEGSGQRGLLLPEVATTYGLDHLAMLRATCGKAGLAGDDWSRPGTTVSAFATTRFEGPAVV